MAIWQYPFEIVPRKVVVDQQGKLPSHLKVEEEGEWINFVDSSEYWKGSQLKADPLVESIDKLLPRDNWTVSNDSCGWKDDTKNNMDNDCFITFNNGFVSSFSCRVDLRNKKNFDNFLIPILNICRQHHLILVGEGEIVIEPNIDDIFNHLVKSRAAQFLKNPKQFFDDNDSKNQTKHTKSELPKKKPSFLTRVWKFWSA